MKNIYKTGHPATYFKGSFELRANRNMAHPIEFPTVFTAFGADIKSGNWQSCTAINTPEYVIKNYFQNNPNELTGNVLECAKELENINWKDITADPLRVSNFIDNANAALNKLKTL